MNVLIVEDEPIPAEYLKTIIESADEFKVADIVDNEDDILKAIHINKIDVIFMDIMIKGSMSGAEIALEIKNIKDNILIIFMTAYSEQEMIEYATQADAFAYLLKPYRPDEITATLALARKKLKNGNFTTKVKNDIINLIQNYHFNIEQSKLYKNREEVKLTIKEKELIVLLAKNLPNILDKEDILIKLNISELSLRSLLYRIRNKTDKEFIQSFKGIGYKLATM